MWLLGTWILGYTFSVVALLFGINRLRIFGASRKMTALDELTVVVPFRNECVHLSQFLACVYTQKYQPVQWIFVNDHSTDDFAPCFDKMEGFPIRILHLPDDQRGKKRAIRYGMDHVQTDYCLTMDADVQFGSEFMKNLLLLPEADLYILPVEMTASKWWQGFFTSEYAFTQVLNKGLTGWFRPINCSGANLLIHVASFDEVDDIEEHDHVLSGDDIYTLRAFRNNDKRIEIIENEALCVTTETPSTLSETINQRLRWIGKSGNVADSLTNTVGFWAVGLHMLYFLLLLISLFSGVFWLTCSIVGYKFLLDALLLQTSAKKITASQLGGLVLFELFYPLYLLVLLVLGMISQPEWKGR